MTGNDEDDTNQNIRHGYVEKYIKQLGLENIETYIEKLGLENPLLRCFYNPEDNFSKKLNPPKFIKGTKAKEEFPVSAKPIPKSAEDVLAAFDEVFIDDGLKDRIVTRVSLPELLEGQQPNYSGVVLYGPSGTGKTIMLRAICTAYEKAGAFAKQVSMSAINGSFVGEFARNLERTIEEAITEAESRGKHSFLAFDEATSLAEKAEAGARTVSKHYQEALDVLKRYVGNDRRVVIAIVTNQAPEEFDEALTREGRLTPYRIGLPEKGQLAGMWKHFAGKYGVMDITDEQALQLADATGSEQGAFVEEFCRTYIDARKAALVRERGCSSLIDALKKGVKVTGKTAKKSLTFEQIYGDASRTAAEGRIAVQPEKKYRPVGFGR